LTYFLRFFLSSADATTFCWSSPSRELWPEPFMWPSIVCNLNTAFLCASSIETLRVAEEKKAPVFFLEASRFGLIFPGTKDLNKHSSQPRSVLHAMHSCQYNCDESHRIDECRSTSDMQLKLPRRISSLVSLHFNCFISFKKLSEARPENKPFCNSRWRSASVSGVHLLPHRGWILKS